MLKTPEFESIVTRQVFLSEVILIELLGSQAVSNSVNVNKIANRQRNAKLLHERGGGVHTSSPAYFNIVVCVSYMLFAVYSH